MIPPRRRTHSPGGRNRKYGESVVEAKAVGRILSKHDDFRPVLEAISLRTTLITGSGTDPHIDNKADDGVPANEDVTFVFLNDNSDAYFQIGEERVFAQKGTMLTFKGTKHHNTVVKKGEVRLLGPFTHRDLQGVTFVGCSLGSGCCTGSGSVGDSGICDMFECAGSGGMCPVGILQRCCTSEDFETDTACNGSQCTCDDNDDCCGEDYKCNVLPDGIPGSVCVSCSNNGSKGSKGTCRGGKGSKGSRGGRLLKGSGTPICMGGEGGDPNDGTCCSADDCGSYRGCSSANPIYSGGHDGGFCTCVCGPCPES